MLHIIVEIEVLALDERLVYVLSVGQRYFIKLLLAQRKLVSVLSFSKLSRKIIVADGSDHNIFRRSFSRYMIIANQPARIVDSSPTR